MKQIILFFALFMIACSTTGEGYMQQKELLAQIEKGEAPIIVDVRSSFEFNSGHVPGAIHIPFWTAFTSDKLDGYKKTDEVVMYCEHGPRAGIAKLALSLAGFDKISYLAGHMTAWRKAALPMEIE